MTPLLSICIPTYNRAHLLRSALHSLMDQVQQSGGLVELVISDNDSTDDTYQIIEGAKQKGPLRYHKNGENIGVIRNILKVVERAEGEFCWLLGDDEMLRPGAVAKVVETLKSHPDLDFFYVNYSLDTFDRRAGKFVTPDDFREWTRTASARLDDHRVDRWEQLIAEDFNALGAMYTSIFRRSMWVQGAADLGLGELFSSAANSYPHAVIYARTMVGKPAFAIGYPWIIMCGTESWAEFLPAAVLLRWHDLLDEFGRNGVDAKLFEHHRTRMLTHAYDHLAEILRGKRASGLESFSIMKFLIKHRRYSEAWRSVDWALKTVPTKEILRASPLYATPAIVVKAFHCCVEVRPKMLFKLINRIVASMIYRLGLPFELVSQNQAVEAQSANQNLLEPGHVGDNKALEELQRKLADVPRYTRGAVSANGWQLSYVDAPALISCFETIVVKRWNDFVARREAPYILDCGANVGITVLHYKKLYPKARIVAFEPDKEICDVLRENLTANGAGDVEVVEAAIWTSIGEQTFLSEGADGSRLVSEAGVEGQAVGSSYTVPTLRLADYLSGEPVDFIKLDIEGAECDVLSDCAELLGNVQSLAIEFHLMNQSPQKLGPALSVLADAGFHLSINSYGEWVDLAHPAREKGPGDLSFDQYLLVCAWRPEGGRKSLTPNS
jgi:FkbM family methyltransferase